MSSHQIHSVLGSFFSFIAVIFSAKFYSPCSENCGKIVQKHFSGLGKANFHDLIGHFCYLFVILFFKTFMGIFSFLNDFIIRRYHFSSDIQLQYSPVFTCENLFKKIRLRFFLLKMPGNTSLSWFHTFVVVIFKIFRISKSQKCYTILHFSGPKFKFVFQGFILFSDIGGSRKSRIHQKFARMPSELDLLYQKPVFESDNEDVEPEDEQSDEDEEQIDKEVSLKQEQKWNF